MKMDTWRRTPVRAYLKQHRPDVLLLQDYAIYLHLLEMGVHIPGEVGAALIYMPFDGKDSGGRHLAGLRSASSDIGQEAVRLLDQSLREGNRGLGDIREVLLPTRFTPGETLA